MLCLFFFFKQKTAYEMRISDWSSDVCSSDLRDRRRRGGLPHRLQLFGILPARCHGLYAAGQIWRVERVGELHAARQPGPDRKSVVSGKRVSVRVDIGGRRTITKKKTLHTSCSTSIAPTRAIIMKHMVT